MRLIPGVAARDGVAIVAASSAKTCLRSIMCVSGGCVKLPEPNGVCDTHDTKKIARGFNAMALCCGLDARICGFWICFVEPGARRRRLTGKLPKPCGACFGAPPCPANRTMTMSIFTFRIPALLAAGSIFCVAATGMASAHLSSPGVFHATEAMSYVIGSKRAIGYFHNVSGKCQLTLMIAEAT